jgi:ketosteroid isomerase-like protein
MSEVDDQRTKELHYQIARKFFEVVADGELPDAMLTPDMTAWLTTAGTIDKASYQHAIKALDALCAKPLAYTINSLTADGDRVIAEVQSDGAFVNGERYANTYVFVLRIRDGLIASVAEHYNALIVQEKLMPLMEEAVRHVAAGLPGAAALARRSPQ